MITLLVKDSVLSSASGGLELTDINSGYKRSIKLNGGFWLGEVVINKTDSGLDDLWLSQFFYEKLGNHFEEKSGGLITWEGLVYEIDYTYSDRRGNTTTRRRSLDTLRNYLTGVYTDSDGVTQYTSAASKAQSIARYGRYEDYVSVDRLGLTAAERMRDTKLKELSWPWAHTIGTGQGGSELTIMLAGYIFTGNWRHATSADGATGNISTWISNLITADCPFLRVGSISTNTIQVTRSLPDKVRVMDLIQNLTEQGDANGNPWRFYVDKGRRAHYGQIDTTPQYYLRDGELYSASGGAPQDNPWLVRPGVIRDMSYPFRRKELGAWLSDGRDFLASEIEVGTGSGLVLKTELFEESELLAAQNEYAARVQAKQQSTGGKNTTSSTGKKHTNWKRVWNIPAGEWDNYIPGSTNYWQNKQDRINIEREKKRKRG